MSVGIGRVASWPVTITMLCSRSAATCAAAGVTSTASRTTPHLLDLNVIDGIPLPRPGPRSGLEMREITGRRVQHLLGLVPLVPAAGPPGLGRLHHRGGHGCNI